MADFFEELGKKISDVASDIGKKTEDTIEIQKLKSNIRGLQRANEILSILDVWFMKNLRTVRFPTLTML